MMTPRARWLAALQMQPVDRLPFWPKLGQNYPPAQQPPYSAMSLHDLHAWVGSDQHTGVGGIVREHRTTCDRTIHTADGIQRMTYHTPHGNLTAEQKWDAGSTSWHPTEFPIKTVEDLQRMQAWYADTRLELDTEMLAQARTRVAELGETALPVTGIGTSPLMVFVEELAGVENAHLFLADAPDEVEALFAEMHRLLKRMTELTLAEHPADLFYFTENTSTTLISPAQYRQYCLPVLQEYAAVGQQAGRLVVLHMCGHLKALLPDLAGIPVAAFEAFTSPTLGNTTLLDGRTACPHTCLIGGTNAMLWLRPPAEIIHQIEEDLDALPHHRGIVVTSAGMMPPGCPPETIREVCAWVQEYAGRW
ncbi:MAG: uroporphyrinogen decarboxylase family protein [Armatimonadota bacterium]